MLHNIIISLGFCQCYSDSCLYVKSESDGNTLVSIYVDNVFVSGTNAGKVENFLDDMQVVELKYLGVVTKISLVLYSAATTRRKGYSTGVDRRRRWRCRN